MGRSITNLSSVTTVGLDLAKHVFQVHGVDALGRVMIAWDELEPFRFRDDLNVDLAAKFLAVLEGHGNAADSSAQNDNTRHATLAYIHSSFRNATAFGRRATR